ncbi:MAG: HAMP domain-containing sensor histidine kinase [Clostridiales bacterium]|nr:HAMP domain-containing sensor histidine kinase [Clostridiales bacterium]
MGLLRNREVKYLLLTVLTIGIIGTAIFYTISPMAAVIGGSFFLLLIAVFFIFTYWRYRQLMRLGDYLKRVNSGDYFLELQDNNEGELSILKSEIYKVTVMLREQNEQLKRDKINLANSLSDISHQLKTPLTSMFVMTDLLCDGDLTYKKRTEFTRKIKRQLERLQWLVESLLKLSKLDADAVAFKCQSTNPDDLIEKACAPMLIPMEIKNQMLSVKTDHIFFVCDPNWTSEALLNIIKNCIEHTPSGGEIDISVFTNALFTQITVKDNGEGMDKADLPYIFNRFYKGKNAGSDSVGIGLAMAKSIIEAQNGTIEVKSKPKEGSEFILRFPKKWMH